MTWIKLIPWLLTIVGFFGTFAAVKLAIKWKKSHAEVSAKLAALSQNLARLQKARENDKQAEIKQRQIDNLIVEAKNEDDAEAIRNMFVNRALDGLRNLP